MELRKIAWRPRAPDEQAAQVTMTGTGRKGFQRA